MALSISTTLANMSTQWNNTCSQWNQEALFLESAGECLIAGNLLAAGNNLYDAGVSLQLGLDHFYANDGSRVHRYLRDALNKINTEWPTGSSVTMDAILNAMLLATFDELTKFIGIEDAYRSAIWDQPFNAEFYGALANGFRP